jgi:ubiquinone/menaquinone biosynthesis C-methylase UbiE
MEELYNLENARKYSWSSITGHLNVERVSHLEKFITGEKILDAGCGGGAYVEFLAKKGLEVTGIDKHDDFLEIAKRRNTFGKYIQGDVTDLPFNNKSFDCTFSFDVLEHVDDVLALYEIARVTSKRMIITVPQKDLWMSRFGLTLYPYQDQTHLRYYTLESLTQLIMKIPHSNIQIFQECFVPLHELFKEMLVADRKHSPISILRSSYRFRVPNSITNKLLTKITDVLLLRLINSEALNDSIKSYISNQDIFEKVNQSLVAVIDL